MKAKIEFSIAHEPYTREEWHDEPRIGLFNRVFDIMGMVGLERVSVTIIPNINGKENKHGSATH